MKSWRPKRDLREIAECVLRAEAGRRKYRDGVVDEAVRRATGLTNEQAVIDAIVTAFEAYRAWINPRWDGSIA